MLQEIKGITEPAYKNALSKPSAAVNGLQPIHNVTIPTTAVESAKLTAWKGENLNGILSI